jgi:hypothetical protein
MTQTPDTSHTTTKDSLFWCERCRAVPPAVLRCVCRALREGKLRRHSGHAYPPRSSDLGTGTTTAGLTTDRVPRVLPSFDSRRKDHQNAKRPAMGHRFGATACTVSSQCRMCMLHGSARHVHAKNFDHGKSGFILVLSSQMRQCSKLVDKTFKNLFLCDSSDRLDSSAVG